MFIPDFVAHYFRLAVWFVVIVIALVFVLSVVSAIFRGKR